MSAHTPGPWSCGEKGNGAVGSVYCDNSLGTRVAIVYGRGQEYTIFSRAEEEANARLIAAAPDLLNALTVLADACASMGIPVDAARAAIAKATGGQP